MLQLTVNKKELSNALVLVLPVTKRIGKAFGALQQVLFNIDGDNLKLSVSDNTVSGEVNIPAKKDSNSDITVFAVNANDLHKIVKSIAGNEISISLVGEKITIGSGSSSFQLPTFPVDDIPERIFKDPSFSFTMDAQKLFSMMQKTAFAMAKSCDNPVVEMMLIELNHIDGIIHTVATDSHRMVIIGEAAELPILEDVDYTKLVVPPQAVIDFQRVLKPVKGEVIVEVGEYFLRIRAGRTVFTTKLAYEKYLNYREIEKIGNQSGKLFNINKKEIQEILKGFVSLTKSVTLHFLNNELKLVGENASCEAKMSIENDINHVVRFNVKYVLDILQHIEGEFFTIKCVDGEGINKLNDYILMEMG